MWQKARLLADCDALECKYFSSQQSIRGMIFQWRRHFDISWKFSSVIKRENDFHRRHQKWMRESKYWIVSFWPRYFARVDDEGWSNWRIIDEYKIRVQNNLQFNGSSHERLKHDYLFDKRMRLKTWNNSTLMLRFNNSY